MRMDNAAVHRVLNILIVTALGIGLAGSVLFWIFGDYLAGFPTSNF